MPRAVVCRILLTPSSSLKRHRRRPGGRWRVVTLVQVAMWLPWGAFEERAPSEWLSDDFAAAENSSIFTV